MSKEEIKKIGEYLNFKYVIARDVNSNDKLETQDRYIQQLYDAYLDLRIKYNDLQSQLDIANKKIEKLDNEIKSVINIIKQQPSNDDEWILGRLNGFLSIIDINNKEKLDSSEEE
jgi:hypothetical protein